ncbi:hypothetical protein [Pseudomonas sp. NCCP-436]|uniref:PA0061/PA0062 family lipoprotein n=1 Tax=Pseudomonas sp. NCCP-436 TaxID=2842481 RepID=UPI001C7EF994|nr:hypothetical protein [Pseudomonas sp. NCCP-436]GIZ10604.1 hypothetical protein NCCP436_00200 [Pseudomonas sp. NCCP-436]
MRVLPFVFSLLLLSACASPLPEPDPQQAWVELYSTADTLLMADRLDGRRWPDGRYFQLSPGAHELQVRFRFEVQRGGLGSGSLSEPQPMICEIRLRHDDFVAGRRYRIEARQQLMKAQAWLYDEQRNVLVRGRVLRCGSAI